MPEGLSTVNLSDLFGFASQIFSSVIALIGVFVGAYIADKSATRKQRLDALSSAYAKVFRCYSEWVASRDTVHLAQLMSAVYEARILASDEVDASLQKLAEAVTGSEPSPEVCSKCLREFWKGAQKEIRKGYGK